MQVGFKRELIKEVRLFVLDAQEFRQDWEANGPMVPGLDPMDAVDRLKKFQLMFEVWTAADMQCRHFAFMIWLALYMLYAAVYKLLCDSMCDPSPWL